LRSTGLHDVAKFGLLPDRNRFRHAAQSTDL
jgi:hypothetical protein